MATGSRVLALAFSLLLLAAPSTGDIGSDKGQDHWNCQDNAEQPTRQQKVIPGYI